MGDEEVSTARLRTKLALEHVAKDERRRCPAVEVAGLLWRREAISELEWDPQESEGYRIGSG